MKKLVCFLLATAICSLNASADSAVPRLWQWDFENIQQRNVPPSTGNARGKLFAGAESLCRIAPGLSGQGLEISGAQKSDKQVGGLNISQIPVDWTKGFTMIVWVKFSPLLAGKELFKANKVIIGNCGVRGPGWLFYLTWGKLYLRSGDGKTPTYISIPFDGFGYWRQLGVVYNGSEVSIYLDGTAVKTEKFVITTASRKDLFVGSSNGSNSQIYGVMDNLLIADQPFTPAQVAENFLKYKP